MKKVFSFLLLLVSISCKQRHSENDKNPEYDFTAALGISISSDWTMRYSSDNGFITQCNVCPVISFKNDGTGSVSRSDLSLEVFGWKFKKGALTILYNDNKPNHTFSDTTYQVAFKNEGMDMILSQKKMKRDFYFSKSSLQKNY